MRKLVVFLLSICVLACGGDDGDNVGAGRKDAGAAGAGRQDARHQDAGHQDAGHQDAGPTKEAADASPPQTGVDPQVRLTELSSDDRERLCGAVAEKYDQALTADAYLNASCTLQAWPLSWVAANSKGEVKGDLDKCKAAVAMCLDQHGTLADVASPPQTLSADLLNPTGCTLPPAGVDLGTCDATVADFHACTAALAAKLGPRLKSVSCDQLGDLNDFESIQPAVDLTTLPECAALQEHCMTLALTLETQPDGQKPGG
jgi:hypothetical protein